MRRWLALALTAVLFVIAVGALVAWLRLRNGGRVTEVSASDALHQFRDSAVPTAPATAAPAAAAPTAAPTAAPVLALLPTPGVYTYATTGEDSVDALGGAHHAYPGVTTMTVTEAGCGVTQRWVAAEERWDETSVCPSGRGVAMQHFTGFHRFFGGDSVDDYTCTGDARPVDAAAGTTWTTTCTASDETVVHHGTVVGRQDLTVGADPVTTLHVTDVMVDGDPSDQQVVDTWYRLGTDLVVRRTADIATESDSPVGVVHYRERYQIDLQSLTPAQ